MSPYLLKQLLEVVTKKAGTQLVKKIASGQRSSLLSIVKDAHKLKGQEALKRARNKPGLVEQGRRIAKGSNIKNAFKSEFSIRSIKNKIGFERNQARGMKLGEKMMILGGAKLSDLSFLRRLGGNNSIPDEVSGRFSTSRTSSVVANARATEQSIIRRLVTNKKQVTDSAPLSSSGCHYGVGRARTAQEDYGLGTLDLTVKQEQKQNGRVVGFKIAGTYPLQNFPLTAWCVMKAAMGRDGTGAGTVGYGRMYKRGGIGGKEAPASAQTEQVLVRGR